MEIASRTFYRAELERLLIGPRNYRRSSWRPRCRSRGSLRWFVLFAALLLLFGHDCLLPGVADATAVADTGSRDAHHDEHGSTLSGCEVTAVKASLSTVSPPIIAESVSPPLGPVAGALATTQRPASDHLTGLPLFLRHASLLI